MRVLVLVTLFMFSTHKACTCRLSFYWFFKRSIFALEYHIPFSCHSFPLSCLVAKFRPQKKRISDIFLQKWQKIKVWKKRTSWEYQSSSDLHLSLTWNLSNRMISDIYQVHYFVMESVFFCVTKSNWLNGKNVEVERNYEKLWKIHIWDIDEDVCEW